MRTCGTCTLCCKLLPVRELSKGAGEKCRHQYAKGCRVYGKEEMPAACRLWNCMWLVDPDARDLSRPDRSRYVIDILPDFVEASEAGGEKVRINVVQVWVDPQVRGAWRDPHLMDYLEMRAERDRMAAIIRFSAYDSIVFLPATLSADGKAHVVPAEQTSSLCRTHTAAEIFGG